MVPAEDILSLIPQRPPFVMIDKLLYCNEDLSRTSFRVTGDNVLADSGEFSEAGLLENIAQTAAAGAGYRALKETKPIVTGFIGSIKNMEIIRLPIINEELITEVKVVEQVFEVLIISGTVFCNDTRIATCEMKLFTNP